MAIDPSNMQQLLARYAAGSLSGEAVAELQSLLQQDWAGIDVHKKDYPELARVDWQAMYARIKAEAMPVETPVRRMRWWRVAVAACVLLVAGTLGWIYFANRNIEAPAIVQQEKATDIKAPAGTKATITLSNGQQVLLDSVASGTIAQQGNTKIIKGNNGAIAYSSAPSNSPNRGGQEMVYNILSNPRGSKVIDIKLSDGTQVWLNAESSLKYPVAFTGNTRKVEITGEAYFEVAHDKTKPFFVAFSSPVGGGREGAVEVLGTHFNVNAYDNESTLRVTLLEGSVKVLLDATPAGVKRSTVKAVTIKPGEQAIIDAGKEAPGGQGEASNITVSKNINTEQVMAWKNGLFQFTGNDLQTVMRQISRWYDVDIVYSGPAPVVNFRGALSRQNNISGVLQMLELTKSVHFKLEGSKVMVSK